MDWIQPAKPQFQFKLDSTQKLINLTYLLSH